MGDPVTMIAIGASLASGAAGAMSAKAGAEAAAEEALFQKKQSEQAARDEILASTQEEVARRRELNSTLSTIDAIRAARGLSLVSPTGTAIKRNIRKIGKENIQIGKINRLSRSVAYKQQATFLGSQASNALKAGGMGRFTSLLSGATSAAGIYMDANPKAGK